MASTLTDRLGNAPKEAIKTPVDTASTANLTLSGEQTVNTVALVEGDSCLVRAQTDSTENGIYNVAVGAWTRTTDFNAENDVVNGVLVLSTGDSLLYQASFSGDYNPGVTSITFPEQSSAPSSDTVQFLPQTAPAHSRGLMYYDSDSETFAGYIDETEVTLNFGEEQWLRSRNNSGSTILNGKVVYITGATGNRPTIGLAKSDVRTTSEIVGVATHDIENNTFGIVTTFGLLRDLDTSSFSEGDLLYLDPTTAGALTATKPFAESQYRVVVATVLASHPNLGLLFIHPSAPMDSSDIALSSGTYDTTTTLIASSASAGQHIHTKRYATVGDGGHASYFVQTSGDFGGTPDEVGGSFTLANGNVAVLQPDPVVNVKQFGAKGDGATDDEPAFTAVVAYMPTKGGRVFVPFGVYQLANNVHVNKPILFDCEGRYDFSTAAATSGTGAVTFDWTGASGSVLFVFSAQTPTLMNVGTTTGEILFGGGIDGAVISGENTAAVGVWLASTVQTKLNIHVRQCTESGVRVDGGNGALSVRNEFVVEAIYGSLAAVEPMVGIHFREFNSFPSTQNRLLSVNGLVKNGDLVRFNATDNNICHHVHGVVASGGTGNAIAFENGASLHARNNVVYYVNGPIKAESSTRGNRILHLNSEGSSVSIDAGGQLHYRVLDYVNAEVWTTHEFKMSDEMHVPSGMFELTGGTSAKGTAAAFWGCIVFLDSSNGNASVVIPAPHDWNDGNITGIRMHFAMGSANTSASIVMRVAASTKASAFSIATPEEDTDNVKTVPDAANALRINTITFASPLAYDAGDSVFIFMQRKPLDASDTAVGDLNLLGITILYEGEGPDSAGSGPFDIPPVGV